jgi:hypothetical protein
MPHSAQTHRTTLDVTMEPPATTKAVLVSMIQERASQIVFALTALVAFLVYGSVLPSEKADGQLGPANIAVLSGPLLAFSITLALGLAAVVTLQVYSVRQAVAARRGAGGRGAVGGVGFLVSLVPSLCCTPVLPAVLAVFGIGASGATATMKAIAPYQFYILTAILVLLALTGWWTLRRITRTPNDQASAEQCC